MTISVVIPVLNEATVLANTLSHLQKQAQLAKRLQVIVADGGSTDDTAALAAQHGAMVVQSARGRSAQMNAGAAVATGEVLYFLHADTLPPLHFDHMIASAIQRGKPAGCFQLRFDYRHWFLATNAWFTRFNNNAVRFGDQSLYVTRTLFLQSGGFSKGHIVLEDQDMVKRLSRLAPFTVLPAAVTTSARKYLDNGIYKTQAVYVAIYTLYQLGYSQQRLVELYKKWMFGVKI